MPYPVAACRGRVFSPSGYTFDLTNLVAYWKLSGLTDSYGANTLTNTGISGFGAGKLGNCANFAGDGNLLSISDNAALSMDTNQAFHIDGWFQHSGAGNNDCLLAKASGGGMADYEYAVRVNTSDRLVFDVSNGATAEKNFTATDLTTLSVDTWYYFAVWHDPVADIVGIAINDTTQTSAYTGGCWNSTHGFQLGARFGVIPLAGKLDDIAIYKEVKDADYRAARYNGGTGQEIF